MNIHVNRLLPIAVVIGLLIFGLGPRSGYAAIPSQCPTLTPEVLDHTWFMSASMEEHKQLRHVARGYNLILVFARRNGEYPSNVEVTIRGIHDNLYHRYVTTGSCGPWFAAKVPDGVYSVTVTYDGRTQFKEAIMQGMMPNRLVFDWS